MSVLRKIGYKDESFVWGKVVVRVCKDVVQVFYAKDLANEGKHVVLPGKTGDHGRRKYDRR